MRNCGCEYIFCGDGAISETEHELILHYQRTGEICLPVYMHDAKYESYLADKTYTIRDDSPTKLKRFIESRIFASFGEHIAPNEPAPRKKVRLRLIILNTAVIQVKFNS